MVDHHSMTLAGIRTFLGPHCISVGTVTDGRVLLQEALRLKPDLIVLDITMPLLNGIDSVIQIKKILPGVTLVFTTMHSDPPYLEAALNAVPTGYVLKSAVCQQLLDAVKSVIEGRLSTRERETLQLIAEGKAPKEIASVLEISVKTVAFHRENIKRKLGLKTTAAITRYALEQGLG